MANFNDYTVVLHVETRPDGSESVAAQLLELPDCIAPGATPREAVARLESVFPGYVATLERLGLPVAQPAAKPSLTVQGGGFFRNFAANIGRGAQLAHA